MNRRPHKVTITKTPGNSEVIAVETEWDGSPSDWDRTVVPVLARLDKRMHEMNMRVLRGAQESRSIDPKAALVAKQILEMVNHVDLDEQVAALEAAGIPA
jgi:hypothetical protein